MTDAERESLRLFVASHDSIEDALSPAVDWVRRQLEIDARRRTPRGPYYGSHGYWASRRSRT